MGRPVDDRLMWESYQNTDMIDEGRFTQARSKWGTGLSNLGSKAISGIGKRLGGSRMGKALTGAGEQGQIDVMEKRAAKLMTIYATKFDRIYAEMKKDAEAVGINLTALATDDATKPGKYPKLAGISQLLQTINNIRIKLGGGGPV